MMSKLLILLSLMSLNVGFASDPAEEYLYNYFKSSVLQHSTSNSFMPLNESLYVDALWDVLSESPNQNAIAALEDAKIWQFSLVERLRLGILRLKYNETPSLDQELVRELVEVLATSNPEIKLIYIIAAHEKLLKAFGYESLIKLAKKFPAFLDVAEVGEGVEELEAEVISDLYHNTPDATLYMGGEYIRSIKLFMICQYNRLFPCLMVMKDINGFPVRNIDGSLWVNGALTSAVTGLPSYERNGNTPAGVFTIDSVMPETDQQISYGKFRRMILNFVPKSEDETLLKSLLPKSSWESPWWKPTTVARDIGRNLFRIHGTGRKDNVSGTPYFPFSRTHGCISQRENVYERVSYSDQRLLLDKIMKSLELEPTFANEPKIKGILYIIDISDKNRPLKITDLNDLGIN